MLTNDQKITKLSAMADLEYAEGSRVMGAALDEAVDWLCKGLTAEAMVAVESITDKKLRDAAKDVIDGFED